MPKYVPDTHFAFSASVPRPGRILLRTINSLICILIYSSSLWLIDPDLKSLEKRLRFERKRLLYMRRGTVQFLISMGGEGWASKIQFFNLNVWWDFETVEFIFVMMLHSKFGILYGETPETPYVREDRWTFASSSNTIQGTSLWFLDFLKLEIGIIIH